tara:strand:+ start:719 stop:1807 length:1089 start_codon:yes stop_codon:yes gene_type:complete
MNKRFKSIGPVFFKKRVLITGNTGFKGSWLSFWLLNLGAKVYGISNNIPTKPSLYKTLNLQKKTKYFKLDIKKKYLLKRKIKQIKPDFIFHLAAQSLVNHSYKDPVETFETNSFGTLNLLESLRFLKCKCIAIIITSDKSYKNLEIKRGYRENDIIGGIDPYSASKGAAELIIKSYIKNYFQKNKNLKICVARAGNVIGGGDWSNNRLVPDCAKSWSKGKQVKIRNPNSTRPWQHVLEALGGYLLLAKKLKFDKRLNGEIFNFGPNTKKNLKVINLIETMRNYWPNAIWKKQKTKKQFYESRLLKLNSNKAKLKLGWRCILTFNETAKMVSEWYRDYYGKKSIIEKSKKDILYYEKLMKERL